MFAFENEMKRDKTAAIEKQRMFSDAYAKTYASKGRVTLKDCLDRRDSDFLAGSEIDQTSIQDQPEVDLDPT